MKEHTKEWLEYAHTDLVGCKKLMDDLYLTNLCVFHAQQAIEKSFKAILVEKDRPVPKIHSLVKLYSLTKDVIDFEVDTELLDLLDKIYINTRYPGDLGLLPSGKPDIELAQRTCNYAEYIYSNIENLLKKIN